MDVIEAMETCRAIRYLKPDPVPEALLRKLVYAATRASNPGNSQGWEFVVLRDPAKKRRIQEALEGTMAPAIENLGADETDPVQRRVLAGAGHLIRHLDQVPVLVFVCGRLVYPPQAPSEQMVWSAVYPAAQNLIVAARSLGLGSTFTTFHMAAEGTVREVLGIPAEVRIGVTLALGYPDRPFGPLARKPVDDVLHWDGW